MSKPASSEPGSTGNPPSDRDTKVGFSTPTKPTVPQDAQPKPATPTSVKPSKDGR